MNHAIIRDEQGSAIACVPCSGTVRLFDGHELMALREEILAARPCEHTNAYTAWTGQIYGVGLPYYQVSDSDFGMHMVCPDCGVEWNESNIEEKENV